jgi:hypothetical protein
LTWGIVELRKLAGARDAMACLATRL